MTHRRKDRKTARQKDRKTEKQKDRKIQKSKKQKDRKIERQKDRKIEIFPFHLTKEENKNRQNNVLNVISKNRKIEGMYAKTYYLVLSHSFHCTF
jgi:hypothetical protein